MTRVQKIVLLSMAALALIALVVVGFANFFFTLRRVPTGNMANTILPGETVLFRSGAGEIERGDIILFEPPIDPRTQYVKRVIGLPGETIQVSGTKVWIDGRELSEARSLVDPSSIAGELKGLASEGEGPYRVYYINRPSQIADDLAGARYGVTAPFRVPPGHYFVLGDSRDNSQDSRYWGTVARERVLGKAWMIVDSPAPNAQERVFQSLR